MNILDMPDAKLYKLGIATLAEHLGRDETTRFLSICKPREDSAEGGGQTLSHTEMKKIEKKIYKTYGTKPPVSHRDLSQMSDVAFYELALNIIFDQLGPVGMMRFIRIRRPGTGDYTAERHQWLDKLDRKAILEGIQEVEKEIKATQINESFLKHKTDAERKSKEAFVLELLRHGDISAGRAAKLLDISRWDLSDLMSEAGISPFAEVTAEELAAEVETGLKIHNESDKTTLS